MYLFLKLKPIFNAVVLFVETYVTHNILDFIHIILVENCNVP